jgi:hypothetical protein
MEIGRMEKMGWALVDEDMALGHTGLEEPGEDTADIGYTAEHVPTAWIDGDRIVDSHKVSSGSDTAAMLDMEDNHTAAAVDTEVVVVMATAVMCVRVQRQMTSLEQERLLEQELEAEEGETEPLCWKLVEEC